MPVSKTRKSKKVVDITSEIAERAVMEGLSGDDLATLCRAGALERPGILCGASRVTVGKKDYVLWSGGKRAKGGEITGILALHEDDDKRKVIAEWEAPLSELKGLGTKTAASLMLKMGSGRWKKKGGK